MKFGSYTIKEPLCFLAASTYLFPAGKEALSALFSSGVSFFFLLVLLLNNVVPIAVDVCNIKLGSLTMNESWCFKAASMYLFCGIIGLF